LVQFKSLQKLKKIISNNYSVFRARRNNLSNA